MKCLIIGAGPAGITAAETIRFSDSKGAIIIDGEQRRPYGRMAIPYCLSGKVKEERLCLRKNPNHFENLRYTVLKFCKEYLIGALVVGKVDCIGVLRSLMQTPTKLGKWKDRLMSNPDLIDKASIDCISG